MRDKGRPKPGESPKRPQTIAAFRKADAFLLALVLGLSVCFALWGWAQKPGVAAVVNAEGKTLYRIALQPGMKRTEYRVETPWGHNLVVAENGTIAIAEADCPDHLCVGMGPIEKAGQAIVCLPHRVSVAIEGGGVWDAISR